MMKMHTTICVLALLVAVAACDRSREGSGDVSTNAESPSAVDSNFLADENLWRLQRQERLTQPDGWTSLHWLELKSHYIGSSASSGIRLAMGPEKMGMVQQEDGRVFFTPEEGVALTLDDEPMTGRV